MRLILLVLLLSLSIDAAKIAIFAPDLANSQILFNSRVGTVLADAGHNVTIYLLQMTEKAPTNLAIDPRIRVVAINGSFGLNWDELNKKQAELAFYDVPLWDERQQTMLSFFQQMYKSCDVILQKTEMMAAIEAEAYDVAFSHMYNFCPIGIIHRTKIPSWIWLNSGALMDSVAELMGVPLPPSYCAPVMMDAGSRLSFVERVKSFVGHAIFKNVWKKLTNSETMTFRKHYGENFPDLLDLAASAPLVMVNSNELYGFARPTLAKIVNIGGLGIKRENAKPLKKEFEERVSKANGIVLFTFGSVAPMNLMPEFWKDAYLHAFEQFPDVQFFLRYENPEELKLPKNVYASKWLPQADLLQNPKALGLISHGGYNSLQDAIHAAVPILCTALFGDQFRNAHLAEELGMGINLHKSKIGREAVLGAVRRLIQDDSLRSKAKAIQAMVSSKPIPAEVLLVKWTEFLAQHKTLDNLRPAGASLSLFVYHSMDVILFLISVISVTALVLYAGIKKLIVCLCCRKAGKKNKKE